MFINNSSNSSCWLLLVVAVIRICFENKKEVIHSRPIIMSLRLLLSTTFSEPSRNTTCVCFTPLFVRSPPTEYFSCLIPISFIWKKVAAGLETNSFEDYVDEWFLFLWNLFAVPDLEILARMKWPRGSALRLSCVCRKLYGRPPRNSRLKIWKYIATRQPRVKSFKM